MLGHIFENLLEDNKDKGAYYTPKPVVSYMCQQSLLHYLQTHLGERPELRDLVTLHKAGDPDDPENWCHQNAKKIATLLQNVKICDPAIGSGAFPIGMLNEIVHIRTLLNSEFHDPAERAALKKSIIQKSIYGVDLDLGAVEIARLRFWLALVVDEVTPSPLPNLDYKIMQGNSLLESFEGVDLSRIEQEADPRSMTVRQVNGGEAELNLLDQDQQEFHAVSSQNRSAILEARQKYFNARKPERKAELRETIDREVINHIRTCLEFDLDKVCNLIDQHLRIADGTLPKPKGWNARSAPKKLAALEKQKAGIEASHQQLEEVARRAERPFFLWHLLFQDVFEEGGFDIVIANPPYIRHELIGALKPLLKQQNYRSFDSTADLFVYFFEQGLRLLRPHGILTFITSNKFFLAAYAENLRSLLQESKVKQVINFGEAEIFEDVGVDSSITILENFKRNISEDVKSLLWKKKTSATLLSKIMEHPMTFPALQLTPDRWSICPVEVHQLIEKLRTQPTTLGEFVDDRFNYGIKTGYNEAFIINSETRARLIENHPECDKWILPFIDGNWVKRHTIEMGEKWIIKIESSTNQTHPWSGAVDPLAKFKETLPSIFERFQDPERKQRLTNRADSGTYYWELRACDYWDDLKKPGSSGNLVRDFEAEGWV